MRMAHKICSSLGREHYDSLGVFSDPDKRLEGGNVILTTPCSNHEGNEERRPLIGPKVNGKVERR